MRKLLAILTLTLVLHIAAHARHIKGGEISYVYDGPGIIGGTDRYIVTLRLFLECGASGQQLDPTANIGIFRNSNNQPVNGSPFIFQLTEDYFIRLGTPNPCISSPSPVCYRLRIYSQVVELPRDQYGYSFVYQRCCRINGLTNLGFNTNIGSSYVCRMNGSQTPNSSPAFAIKDTVLICQNRPFQLDFSAQDSDGDSLSYEFCDALDAPQGGGGGQIDPVSPVNIRFVQYGNGYSGEAPLGNGVTIDPVSGLISGTAPPGGDYVISVCVKEWRAGVLLSEHRKDFNIQIDQRCDIAGAALKPEYINCEDFTVAFQNELPPTSLIHTYFWDFGVPFLDTDTSSREFPSFTYSDTGVYKIKLHVNRGEQCPDSAETVLRLYPGFTPGFTANGSCVQVAYQFTDATVARYGSVTQWRWDFGDETTTADNSTAKNPSWKYQSPGNKTIRFTVGSSLGCTATLNRVLDVRQQPTVQLAFRDTLICSIDTLQLLVNGPGNYLWGQNNTLVGATTPNPLVFPKTSTTYTVLMNDNGCVNTDSVRVNVVDFVTLEAGPDSSICLTDTILLNPVSDGLQFSWSPAASLNSSTLKTPLAFPGSSTMYTVVARIGKCSSTDSLRIRPIPYPIAYAGADTLICDGDTALLHGQITGSSFSWSPTLALSNPSQLSTAAFPKSTTRYTLTVTDTLGCPKPVSAQVLLSVSPPVLAFAGNDTSIVRGQELVLAGSGGTRYEWSPALYLNNYRLQSPTARLNDHFTYILKATTADGCFAFDTIAIRVFKTAPDIYVPNAFAPGGNNRLLRPIPVGIASFHYFRVFNRWGQLVYETHQTGQGWDGNIAGKPQQQGTYVWQVSGIDFNGRVVRRQGTAILIR